MSLLAIAGGLLVCGLCCFWVSLDQLTRPEREAFDPPVPEPAEEPEEEKPRLTRLGRPIVEIQLQPRQMRARFG